MFFDENYFLCRLDCYIDSCGSVKCLSEALNTLLLCFTTGEKQIFESMSLCVRQYCSGRCSRSVVFGTQQSCVGQKKHISKEHLNQLARPGI